MKKPQNVDEYISSFPEEIQAVLEQIRSTVKKAAPEAEEVISYSMPAYKLNGVLCYFAAFESHIGFYALPEGNETFKKELSQYKTGKGSIQFPLNKPIPFDLITKIVAFRRNENLLKKEHINQ